MPLSEHEQRLLEQMERALYAEDPKFASSLRGKDARSSFRRNVVLASVGFLLGIVLLMTGLVFKQIGVSILGFVAMLVCALFALTSYRRVTSNSRLGVVEGGAVRTVRRPGRRPGRTPGRGPAPGQANKARERRSFMERVEERWNRRRDENGR